MRRYRFAIIPVFVLAVHAQLFGVSWYITPDIYTAAWKVGAFSERTVTNQRGYQVNYPGKVAWLSAVGLHSTLLFGSGWAMTLGGSLGYVNDSVSQSSKASVGPYATTCSGFACNVTTRSDTSFLLTGTVLRQDYNLAISKRIGNSPVSVFVGTKFQQFVFDGKDDNALNSNTSDYALTVAPFTSGTTAPTSSVGKAQAKSSSQAAGASLGIGYTVRMTKSLQFASQVSLLWLRGILKEEFTSKFNTESRDNMTSYFDGFGFTFLFSVVKPVSESGFLQISLRGQYYITKVYAREATYNDQITGAIIQSNPAPSSANFHNAADYIGGLQIAFVQRVLGEQ